MTDVGPGDVERWAPIPGLESSHEISTLGQIRSIDRIVPHGRGSRLVRGRLLSTVRNPQTGYWDIQVRVERRTIRRRVHVVILEAFVGPRPEGMFGCHNDGDKDHNWLANLRWDTPSANTHDMVLHGVHSMARKTHCVQGHPLVAGNLLKDKRRRADGVMYRNCKTCHYARRDAREQRIRTQRMNGAVA